MPDLWNVATQRLEFVPNELVTQALASKQYTAPAGLQMSTTMPSGRVVQGSPEQAAALGEVLPAAGVTPEAELRALEELAYYSTPGQALEAAGQSFVSGATLGLSDVGRRIFQPEAAVERSRRAAANPALSTIGTVAGAVAPTLLTGGTGGLGAVARATPTALAQRAGAAVAERAGGKVLGRALGFGFEGALQGAGQGVQELALAEDPLTAERVVGSLTSNALLGGILGAGSSLAGSALEKGLARARTAVAEKAAQIAQTGPVGEISADLAALDATGLRKVEQAELDNIAAARAADKQQIARDAVAYHEEVKTSKPWLATKGDADFKEIGKVALKADQRIRNLLDNPLALEEHPRPLKAALQQQQHALEQIVEARPRIEAKIAAEQAAERTAEQGRLTAQLATDLTIADSISKELARSEERLVPRYADFANEEQIIERTVPLSHLTPRLQAIEGEIEGRLPSIEAGLAAGKEMPPVRVVVGPDDTLFVADGRHRLMAYNKRGVENVRVSFESGVTGRAPRMFPEAGTGSVEGQTILLSEQATRRWARWKGEEGVGTSIAVTPTEARQLADELRSGRVPLPEKPMSAAQRKVLSKKGVLPEAGTTRLAALDAAQAALERNKALQTRLDAAYAEPASPRLEQIRQAKDLAQSRPPERGMAQKMLEGAAYGATVGTVSGMLPGFAQPAAYILGAKVADKIGSLVFGRTGKVVSAAAARQSAALEKLLGAAERGARALPPVATRVLAHVRFAPPRKGQEQPARPTLQQAFKARAEELRAQVTQGPDGKAALRPETEAAIMEVLRGVAAINAVAADRMAAVVRRRVTYLADALPRRPDYGALQVGPDRWQPSDMEARHFARLVAVTENPFAFEERLADGHVTPGEADAYRAVYPEMHASFTMQVVERLPELRKTLSPERRLALSIFTGVPVEPALDAAILRVLQRQHLAEEGTEGGTRPPRALPQFGSISREQPTHAQRRSE